MKQPEDNQTAELKLPGKKGRPATGTAKTAAQRQANKRHADKREIIEAIGNEKKASRKALLALMNDIEKSESAKNTAKRAWEEFGIRYGLNW